MPFSFSKTGSTALREADVQQPKTAAQRSLIRSFLDFSAKVGQSDAPSSLITLILRPRMPPMALIWSMASCAAGIEPVSEIAMVPVAECSWPTVTSVSVMASLVVLTCAVGCALPQEGMALTEAAPSACSRRRRPASAPAGWDCGVGFFIIGPWVRVGLRVRRGGCCGVRRAGAKTKEEPLRGPYVN